MSMKSEGKAYQYNCSNGKCILREIVLEGSPSNTISLHDLAYAQ